jgi:ribosome maturation factor RimP
MTDFTPAEKAAKIAEPILESMGLELVDIEFRREQAGWVLRIYIDREGGVTLDDCASASREVGAAIEIEDLIEQHYSLEVSSPGLTRPLKRLQDFERFKGCYAKLKFYGPVDGKKSVVGMIKGIDQNRVVIDLEGYEMKIDFSEIAKANLEYRQEG